MLFYAIFMCFWLLALAKSGWSAIYYVALALVAVQVLWHYRLIRQRERGGCFQAFRLNHWIGATLFAGIALGYLQV